MGVSEKFSNSVGSIAFKLSDNKYLSAIKDSFMSIIPFTIVGSVAVLFGSVIFGPSMLGGISGLEFLQELAPLFTAINFAAMNFMAIMIAYLVGYNLAKQFKVEGPVYAGLLSLASLLILVPTFLRPIPEDTELIVNNVVTTNVTGSRGLFVAIIAGLVVTRIYASLTKVEKLKIRLHESVPENVAKSFTALLPTLIIMFGVGVFSYAFVRFTGLYFSEVVYTVLQTPLEAAMQHPLGIVFAALFAHLLWIFGIHGASLTTGMLDPLMLSALAVNTELVQQGLSPTEVVTRPFWNMYATMGGSGCTLALLVAIFVAGRRDDEKAIARLSVGPGLFGINEPVIFGLPIVFSPIYAIPFILSPVVSVTIGYFATASGFASPAYVNVPWSMPPLVNGFIATGGDLNTVLVQFICMVVTFFIYLPFVKMSNKQYARQQASLQESELEVVSEQK